jgi:xanthine dehydrogenase accessory factor
MRWRGEGKSIALATVIQTWGSSPRGVGSNMALTLEGDVVGSVSGGCVENAVVEAGIQSLKTDRPQLLHFGVADETAWEVGLACGGSIDVFVKPLDNHFFETLQSGLENNQSLLIATVIRGSDSLLGRELLMLEQSRSTGWPGTDWNGQIEKLAAEIFSQGISQRVALNNETELFFEMILPPPTLIMVGGVHIAIALSSLAKTLGYRTVVIDPRKAWGNSERFSNVDQLIQTWPDEAFRQIKITRSTAIATLTHDPKLDDPALKYALSSPAFYVGALGSMSTQAKRRERLSREGLSEPQLNRLHGPIGLDIHARTPEEIALAIMAEVVDAYRKQKQEPVEVDTE